MRISEYLTSKKENKAMFESIYGSEEEKTALTASQLMFEAISNAADTNTQASAMTAVIEWNNNYDPTYEDLDIVAQGVADIDDDGELTDDEEDEYNEILFGMSQAMQFLGVNEKTANLAARGNDDAALEAYDIISDTLENSDSSEDELIAEFSVSKELMTESTVKVFKDGKAIWKKVPLKKRKMTPAQKAALKKARMKANTSAAKAKRAKTMKKRKSAGL